MIPKNTEIRNRDTWKDLPESFIEQTPEAQDRRNITFLLQEAALHEGVALYDVLSMEQIESPEDRAFLTGILPGAKAALVMGRPIVDPWYRLEQLVPGISMQRTTTVSQSKVEIHLRRFQEKVEIMGYQAEIYQSGHTPDPAFAHILSLTGQGFVGKNGYFNIEQHGCRTNFGLVVTDAPLMGGDLRYGPYTGPDCGDCTACIDACPAGALSDQGYDREKCEAFRNDPEKQLKFSKYSWFKCDMCMRACPRGKSEPWDRQPTSWEEILRTGKINF